MAAPEAIRRLINHAWIAGCTRNHAAFASALEDVSEIQERHLMQLVYRNRTTRYGGMYDFSKIKTVEDFQSQVPICTYDTLEAEVKSIAKGNSNVLTTNPVLRFLPTSGSSSASKFIPWTKTLAQEFRRGIDPWLWSLYHRRRELFRGTGYWSLSPPVTRTSATGQVPVGFEDDSAYLGFVGKQLFRIVSTAPSSLTECSDINEFRTQTLVALLADENLSLISVWSPTFLSTLFEDLMDRTDEIFEHLYKAGAKDRAARLRSEAARGLARLVKAAWPRLQVISCWTHGPSELYSEILRKALIDQTSDIEIQGKGLVATEAFVSLPFKQGQDPVLAVTSHFFEFQNPITGKLCLAHQVSSGEIYRVLVTTGGGLYRYFLGDLVRVTGFIGTAPCLRFIGREGNVSDMCGEKLNGMFIDHAVTATLISAGIKASFFLLAPEMDCEGRPGYVLFLESQANAPLTGLQKILESELMESFHYAHCRNLGQLRPASVYRITSGTESAADIFTREMVGRGIKIGDVKLAPLDKHTGWANRFTGHICSE